VWSGTKLQAKTFKKNIFSFEFLREKLPKQNIENADNPYMYKIKRAEWTNTLTKHMNKPNQRGKAMDIET
jgi:flagellar basal body rod protein FlgB